MTPAALDGAASPDEVALAEAMTDELAPADGLRVVGYFSPERTGTTFVRDDVARQYTERELTTPIEDALLESVGLEAVESYFDDELRAASRVFADKFVVACHAPEHRGVVVSLDRDAERSSRDVVATFEALLAGT